MGALTMEIEKVNNSFLTEKQQKRREKEQKQQYEQELFNKFYNYFKSRQHNYELNYKYFNNIHKREELLNTICKNSNNIMYLNTIYSKKLKEVYKIFKDNFEYIQEQESNEQEEYKQQMQLLTNNLQNVLNQKIIAQKQQEQKVLIEKQKQDKKNKIIINIFVGIGITLFILYFLIKWGLIIGIGAIILLFIFIAGCAKGK